MRDIDNLQAELRVAQARIVEAERILGATLEKGLEEIGAHQAKREAIFNEEFTKYCALDHDHAKLKHRHEEIVRAVDFAEQIIKNALDKLQIKDLSDEDRIILARHHLKLYKMDWRKK